MSRKIFLDQQGRAISAEDLDTLPTVNHVVKVSLVDLNLMSGSSDRLRAACGGYFTNIARSLAAKAQLS